MARWTYAFLLIHNLVTITHYAIGVITRLQLYPERLEILSTIHTAFNEVIFFTIVLCVPISYLIGFTAQCCCGMSRGGDMEMDKVDKIYTDVWTTPSARNGNSAIVNSSRPASATPSITTMTNINSGGIVSGNGNGYENFKNKELPDWICIFRSTKWSRRKKKPRRWLKQYVEQPR